MLKGFDPGQKLLFGKHRAAAHLEIGNPPGHGHFIERCLAQVEKLCGFGELVEPLERFALRRWLSLRGWWLSGWNNSLSIEEFSLNRLQRRDDVL